MNMKVENEMTLPTTKSVMVMLLEPYAGKLARTVLRGESSRKGADLLDHDKGFEILSVSLDDKKDNWVNAIEKNDLNWGHVSSLKGWDCPVAKLYNVSGVPAMLLIDKEGKIVATKLRGDLLMEKVAEQFEE